MKDHIPDWAGSRRGPQCDTGRDRLAAIASGLGGTVMYLEQACAVVAALERAEAEVAKLVQRRAARDED